MHSKAVQPVWFGNVETRLFGCYHAPRGPVLRQSGIILCYPMGHEYIRSHRTYRQVAVRLANMGFPVLRFDFSGCGDSGGDCESGNIHQWVSDISRAIEEIRRQSSIQRVCLLGSRLGGSLSVIAGADRGDIHAMVLWDPIVCGRAYITELEMWHRQMVRYAHVKPDYDADGQPQEVLGFALPPDLRADIERIDLFAVPDKPAREVLYIESDLKPRGRPLQDHLLRAGAQVRHESLPNPDIWLWIEDVGNVLMPNEIIQTVVSWIGQKCA